MTQELEEAMTRETDGTNWRDHLIETPAQIKTLLENTHRIAVLGIKPDPDQPAYYVPDHAEHVGYEIVPVPVYYPDLTEMMGKKVYRKIADIPGEIDMVNVFRRPKDIAPHVDDILWSYGASGGSCCELRTNCNCGSQTNCGLGDQLRIEDKLQTRSGLILVRSS
jgi:predicted CoA-binding protein